MVAEAVKNKLEMEWSEKDQNQQYVSRGLDSMRKRQPCRDLWGQRALGRGRGMCKGPPCSKQMEGSKARFREEAKKKEVAQEGGKWPDYLGPLQAARKEVMAG